MGKVRPMSGELCVGDLISFHIYPKSDLDVTQDKQQGQKTGENLLEEPGGPVPSEKSLPFYL